MSQLEAPVGANAANSRVPTRNDHSRPMVTRGASSRFHRRSTRAVNRDTSWAWRSDMEKVAVAVMPITDIDAWQSFMKEISAGDRTEAHRAFLRRGGVQTEHVFRQQTPMGD